ncbi:MAG: hypothetical protein RBU21_20865, partial [FCB group bacterium]|nr:hypothetical protein [FCB group bacterium]
AQAGPPPGGPGGPGGGGNFNPAQLQEMMLQRVQRELGATESEWESLAPLVENVLQLQQATRMGGMGGPGGPRGRGPRGPEALATEIDALRTVLDSDTTTDEQITAALKDLRSTRAAEEQKFLKAREDLRAAVTLRQEAKLVLLGLLD